MHHTNSTHMYYRLIIRLIPTHPSTHPLLLSLRAIPLPLSPAAQCIAPVATALRAGFLPFAPDVFRRCVRVGTAYFAAEDQAVAIEQARRVGQCRSVSVYGWVWVGEGQCRSVGVGQ